jgi:hypothetical protein
MPTLLLAVSLASFAGIAYSVFLPWVKVTVKFNVEEGDARPDIEVLADGRGGVTVSNPRSEVFLRDNQKPEGFYVMLLAVAGGVVLAVAFGSASVGKIEGASRAALIFGVIGSVAVAMTLIVWQTAWVYKVTELARHVKATTPPQTESYTSLGQREYITNVGFGLYLGIGLSLAAALFVSMAAKNHVRMFWLHVAEAFGLIAGVVIVLVIVEPWDAGKLWNGLEPYVRLTGVG